MNQKETPPSYPDFDNRWTQQIDFDLKAVCEVVFQRKSDAYFKTLIDKWGHDSVHYAELQTFVDKLSKRIEKKVLSVTKEGLGATTEGLLSSWLGYSLLVRKLSKIVASKKEEWPSMMSASTVPGKSSLPQVQFDPTSPVVRQMMNVPAVKEIASMVKSGDTTGLKAFLKKNYPPKPQSIEEIVLDGVDLYVSNSGDSKQVASFMFNLNVLVRNYCLGRNPKLGVITALAIIKYSEEAFVQTGILRHFKNVEAAAIHTTTGLRAVGRHAEIIVFANEMINWLKHFPASENIPILILDEAEALIELVRYEEAKEALGRFNLQPSGISKHALLRKENLDDKLATLGKSGTELPEKPLTPSERIEKTRKDTIGYLEENLDIFPEELQGMMQQFLSSAQTEEELKKGLPKNEEELNKWLQNEAVRIEAMHGMLEGKPIEEVRKMFIEKRPDLKGKLPESFTNPESDGNS